MYDINELNLDIDIEEYQLNNTDFNNLLDIDLDYE